MGSTASSPVASPQGHTPFPSSLASTSSPLAGQRESSSPPPLGWAGKTPFWEPHTLSSASSASSSAAPSSSHRSSSPASSPTTHTSSTTTSSPPPNHSLPDNDLTSPSSIRLPSIYHLPSPPPTMHLYHRPCISTTNHASPTSKVPPPITII